MEEIRLVSWDVHISEKSAKLPVWLAQDFFHQQHGTNTNLKENPSVLTEYVIYFYKHAIYNPIFLMNLRSLWHKLLSLCLGLEEAIYDTQSWAVQLHYRPKNPKSVALSPTNLRIGMETMRSSGRRNEHNEYWLCIPTYEYITDLLARTTRGDHPIFEERLWVGIVSSDSRESWFTARHHRPKEAGFRPMWHWNFGQRKCGSMVNGSSAKTNGFFHFFLP